MVRSLQSLGRSVAVVGRALDPIPTSTTTIDSFEDENITEYSGDTGSFTTTNESTLSWGAPDGSIVVEKPASAGNFNRIYSTPGDGLNSYFPKGNIGRCHVRADANCEHRTLFGVEDFNDYYIAEVKYNTGIAIKKRTGGTLSTPTSDTSVDPTPGTTGEVEIVWDDGTLGGSDNDITVRYIEGGSQLGPDLTTNDPDHATAEGVGFTSASADSDTLWWDNYRLTT